MSNSPSRLHQVMDWRAAIWAGIIAGAIFLLLQMILLALVTGGSPWILPRMTAAIVLGEGALSPPASFDVTITLVALIIHFVLAIGFAVLIAFILHRWGLLVGIVGGALDAIPGVGAVRAVVRDAIPFGQVASVILGGGRQLWIDVDGLQAVLLAVGVDQHACLLDVELGVTVVAIGERAFRRLVGGAGWSAVRAGEARRFHAPRRPVGTDLGRRRCGTRIVQAEPRGFLTAGTGRQRNTKGNRKEYAKHGMKLRPGTRHNDVASMRANG